MELYREKTREKYGPNEFRCNTKVVRSRETSTDGDVAHVPHLAPNPGTTGKHLVSL
jgi:hypothetical protein